LLQIYYIIISDNFDNKGFEELKTSISNLEKSTTSAFKTNAALIQMLNNSNVRLCKAIETMDQKLQTIMKADARVRALALPIPALPAAFIDMLPVYNIELLDTVECMLSPQNEDGLKNREDLVINFILVV